MIYVYGQVVGLPSAEKLLKFRLGDFFNFFVTNLLSKVGIIIGDLWGYFEINHFLGKTAVDTFWQTLRRNWTTFYSAIWSH